MTINKRTNSIKCWILFA